MSEELEKYPEPLHLREASRQELIGAIMVRSQVVEQVMREMIAEVHTDYASAGDVLPKATFGPVKKLFKETFKKRNELFECLEPVGLDRVRLYEYLDSVNDARNNAAHSHFLVAVWLQDVMKGYPDQQSVNRLVTKGIRRDAEDCDRVLNYLMTLRTELFKENRLFFTDIETNAEA